MPKVELPPLEYDGEHGVDKIMPGYVESHSGIRAGDPVIEGTRIPVWAYWPMEFLDDPEALAENRITREQVIAAQAFHLGMEWQRGRKRRKRIDDFAMRRLADAIKEVAGEAHYFSDGLYYPWGQEA